MYRNSRSNATQTRVSSVTGMPSSGSACTSGSLEPSHVMAAMAVPQTYAHGSIRFSFSVYNTEAEVDFVLKEMPPIIERLRAISPFADGKPLFGMVLSSPS